MSLKFGHVASATVLASALFGAAAVFAQDAPPLRPGQLALDSYNPVTAEMLLDPPAADWLMMRGNYENWGYSRLDQINDGNVADLQLAWARGIPVGANQGAPLVHDGVMFLPAPWGTVQAINAATGDLIWEFTTGGQQTVDTTNGPIFNSLVDRHRSIFLWEDMVITTTYQNHIVALNAQTGQVIWDIDRGDSGQVASTNGPIVVNGVVIAGSSCQFAGFGCYVTGHDVTNGEELWRNEFIPRPGEPGDETWGGVPFENRWCTGAWGQISYDATLNLVYYGSTGICPAAEFQRNQVGAEVTLAGTNTRFAVRPDTGEIVWSHQVLPNDNWDQECTFDMFLIDTPVNPNANAQGMLAVGDVTGETRRTLTGMPCKNPVYWSFDAATGEFLYAKATWAEAQNLYESINGDGVPTMNREVVLDEPGEEVFFCSSFTGGRDWPSGAYDPTRNVMFMPTTDNCTYMSARMDREPAPNFVYNTTTRGVLNPAKDNDNTGRIDAVNAETGDTLWTWETRARNYSPILATAGNVLFNSGADRYFRAHSSETGDLLWETRLGSRGSGYTVTYEVDGRQYVATMAGTTLGGAAVTPEVDDANGFNMIYVFALPN
ncbi:MAG: PQQ-binding-like beta-propeller repeat protein [Bauldia sp.]|nr:PQQ-binding-like beta-propeller repeat protein [Bauldia sp.]